MVLVYRVFDSLNHLLGITSPSLIKTLQPRDDHYSECVCTKYTYSLDEENETLNAMLNVVLSNIPKEAKILLVRDFNAR